MINLRDNETGEPFLTDLKLPDIEGSEPLEVIERNREHVVVSAMIAHLRDVSQLNYRAAALRFNAVPEPGQATVPGFSTDQLIAIGRVMEEQCLKLFAIRYPEALAGGEVLHPADDLEGGGE
jgi:hypothetical protein